MHNHQLKQEHVTYKQIQMPLKCLSNVLYKANVTSKADLQK